VPYFLWSLLAVLFFYVAQLFPTQIYFNTQRTIIRQFKLLDWVDVFWGKLTIKADGFPLVAQFWFIREAVPKLQFLEQQP
jgi:hypothetical protein